MKSFFCLLPLLGILFLFGCKPDDTPPDVPLPTGPDFEAETIIPTGDEQYLNMDSDYIYDQSRLHTFELKIPPAGLQLINSDPAAEQYVEASLIFDGDTISPVGVRYKGSIGAFVGCTSGNDWSNPSGRKTCTKLSMKVKINWDDPEARFYKLKKLQFHAMNLDPTQMRERLGYWLFREMGVPAPRSVHARLIINGEYSGLYALVEQIDGRFTRYNFDDGTGNLYKEIWPINDIGFPHSHQAYLANLKTNEDENPSVNLIRSFGEQIATPGQQGIRAVIEKWMDIDKIISYAVVDRTIRNDDGAFHWYCGAGGCSNHNYYWYEDPTREKLHLIPWDLDNAFENIISNENPVTPIADEWGEVTNGCASFNYGAFQYAQRSAACDKLTAGWVSYEDEYEETLDRFKTGPFAEASVTALLDEWTAQVRPATIEARQLHGDALSTSQWEGAVNSLKAKLRVARNK